MELILHMILYFIFVLKILQIEWIENTFQTMLTKPRFVYFNHLGLYIIIFRLEVYA